MSVLLERAIAGVFKGVNASGMPRTASEDGKLADRGYEFIGCDNCISWDKSVKQVRFVHDSHYPLTFGK